MPVLTDDMKGAARQQKSGFVAAVCPPNLSPKGTMTVWDGNMLIFADIRSPGTVENLRRNSAVEINVVHPAARSSNGRWPFIVSTAPIARFPLCWLRLSAPCRCSRPPMVRVHPKTKSAPAGASTRLRSMQKLLDEG